MQGVKFLMQSASGAGGTDATRLFEELQKKVFNAQGFGAIEVVIAGGAVSCLTVHVASLASA